LPLLPSPFKNRPEHARRDTLKLIERPGPAIGRDREIDAGRVV
jgi:hypothetical protein